MVKFSVFNGMFLLKFVFYLFLLHGKVSVCLFLLSCRQEATYEVILNVALWQPLRKSYLGCSYAQKKSCLKHIFLSSVYAAS